MIRFGNPYLLQLLWTIPLLWIAAAVIERRARLRLAKAFGPNVAALASGNSDRRRRWKRAFALAALAFAVVALARPQIGKSAQKIKSEGVEMVFAVDVSTSMLAEDVKPSRLERAKSELSRLLDLLGGDKVGIVAFAGSATLVSPLTNDKSALKMFLESLSPQSVETQGTEFRKALREARAAFDRGGIDPEEGGRVTRVVLLASDGEDQEPGALEEARKLADDGVRVFAMAFGTERGAPIPLRDERGYVVGYKRDRAGQTVNTQVKGDFLKSLAQTGRGSFYLVSYGGDESKAVRADIGRLEKTQFESEIAANYDERFQIPLALAILAMLADLAIGERSTGRAQWLGRFGAGTLKAARRAAGKAAIALLLAAPVAARASELGGVWSNNRGVSKFKNGKASEATKKFSEAVSQLPDNAQAHINLGDAFAANKDYEKALDEFATASRMAKSPSEKFKALFSAGAVAGELKRVDEALDYYQRALEHDPKSVETKSNIELLAQQGAGGGKGDDDQKKQDQKNGEGKDKEDQKQGSGKDQKQPQPQQNQADKPKPKPFESKDISQDDVKKILDELKQQEEQIRAKYQRQGAKDAPRAKDW